MRRRFPRGLRRGGRRGLGACSRWRGLRGRGLRGQGRGRPHLCGRHRRGRRGPVSEHPSQPVDQLHQAPSGQDPFMRMASE
ncbi:hypothetical protein APASM_4377 [Actinosynnema pretiosum subsp. pretiosum]|nr:hypothetical protein APASM_4377 [Actinosynnema pretiosum subsp. pretiosum]